MAAVSTWPKRIFWFVSLWVAGVGVTGAVAFAIRLWLAPPY